MKRGFTLLETLASLVVLGILASSAASFAVRLGRAEIRSAERWQASVLLQSLRNSKTLPEQEGITEIPEHPGWWLRAVDLERESAEAPTAIPRHWRSIEIISITGDSRHILADLVILAPEGMR
jgi:prepilin-type N-terminal cleavage/methylation domain-containing protein